MIPERYEPKTVREIVVALYAAANAMDENLQMGTNIGRLMTIAAEALSKLAEAK